MRGRLLGIVVLTSIVLFMSSVGVSAGTGGTVAAADDLDIDPDSTVLTIDLAEDGTAEWTIDYRMVLTTDEEVAAFDELADDIAADPAVYTERFRDRMEPTVEGAADATGREMAIADVSIETERRFVDREYGIVTYRFTWEGFAERDGPDLHAGDAISGMFLTEDTALVIRWPSEFDTLDVRPTPDAEDDTSVRWSGPRDFGAFEPRLIVSTDAPAFGLSPTDPLTWAIALGLVMLLLAGVGASRVMHRRRERAGLPPEEDAADLLSNEERVLRLIEANGGRMKQQEVAEQLDWTDAKTSKVVRSLRDAGDLEGFRLGRENILRLPGEEDPGDASD